MNTTTLARQGKNARARMALLIGALIVTIGAPPAAAEVVDVQHWHNLFVQGRMLAPGATTSPALFYLELQPRFSVLEAKPDRVLLRGAVGWEIARGLTVWAGAAGIPAFDAPQWRVSETRLWQQLMFTDRLGPVALMWRGRFEQRTLEGAPSLALRTRAMLRAVYTLPVGDGAWGVVAFDELFVGLLGPEGRTGFDQNRAFVGALHKLTPWLSVEGGYLYVQAGAPGSTSSRQLHTVLVQTIANLL